MKIKPETGPIYPRPRTLSAPPRPGRVRPVEHDITNYLSNAAAGLYLAARASHALLTGAAGHKPSGAARPSTLCNSQPPPHARATTPTAAINGPCTGGGGARLGEINAATGRGPTAWLPQLSPRCSLRRGGSSAGRRRGGCASPELRQRRRQWHRSQA